MWRLHLFWIAWVFVLTAEAIPMAAHGQSYEQNALRLDSNFGDVRIVRGVEGTVVGRIGVFRGVDVTQIVAGSPNAVAEAREFQRNYRPGTIVLGLGLISLGASVGASQIHDVNRGITTGLTIATFG
ncbi:MAG TPA: hypothetical protein VK542_06650, partial [Gemmatimonadaceae bacterium]|nr:hypothetical protein [Gemmatimonadaceae bacterium]